MAEAALPRPDTDYLDEKEYDYQLSIVGGNTHVVLRDFLLGDQYSPPRADVLIVVPAGYPNAHPDMFWTQPTVRLAKGGQPLRAGVENEFPSGQWQRWSRHYRGEWRPGVDTLRTYIAAVRAELGRGL